MRWRARPIKTSGWAVQDALHDQIALLDYFNKTYGEPERTIAWGHSLGGMIGHCPGDAAGARQTGAGRGDRRYAGLVLGGDS